MVTGKKVNILIADSESEHLRLLEEVLHSLGYETIPARDGQEALEKLKQSSPDVILLDAHMHG